MNKTRSGLEQGKPAAWRGWVSAGIVVAGLVAGLVWLFGQYRGSPDSEVEPDEAAIEVTAQVERRVLLDEVRMRGLVVSPVRVDVGLPPLPPGVLPVVTKRVADSGDVVSEGDLLVEVSGIPVVFLVGELPQYRTLSYGMEGPDVRQLGESMRRLGFLEGEVGGRFDDKLVRAVATFYGDLGYEFSGSVASMRAQLVIELGSIVFGSGDMLVVDSVPFGTLLTGGESGQSPVVLTVDNPTVEARVLTAQRALVEVGMRVDLECDDSLLPPLGGVVASIEPRIDPASGEEVAFAIVEFADVSGAPPLGTDLLVRVYVSDSSGEDLVIPLASLADDGTGNYRVVRVNADGERETIPVDLAATSGGYAAVEDPSGRLNAGDEVLVGYE